MNTHQEQVKLFIKTAGGDLPDKPTLPDDKIRQLCARLILEECVETLKALGYVMVTDMNAMVFLSEIHKPDMIELADGIADSHYVLTYAACKFGIDEQPIQTEVNINNLEKFKGWKPEELRKMEDKGYKITFLPGNMVCVKNPMGKVQKPPGHIKPDIKSLLELQGWKQKQQ